MRVDQGVFDVFVTEYVHRAENLGLEREEEADKIWA